MSNQPQQIVDEIMQKLLSHPALQSAEPAKLQELRGVIHTRLENKVVEVFLSLMTPEQLDIYEKAIDTNDATIIEKISAEIAVTIPQFPSVLNTTMEVEYQQIVNELSDKR